MLRYIIKRTLQAIPLMIGITALCFLLINLAPYDAVDAITTDKMTQEEIERSKAFEQSQNYEKLVEQLIRERYTLGQELAILRQRDTKPEEFAEYNAYAEKCKTQAKEQLKG